MTDRPSPPTRIREYRDGDTPLATACLLDLQAHERRLEPRMLAPEAIAGWYLDHLLDECRKYDGTIFVAEHAGAVVGLVAVQTRVPSTDKDEETYDYAYISDLGVREAARGRGIGGALLAAAETFARERGARWLRISVLAGNEGARRLYRESGFRERVVTLEKPLSDDDTTTGS